MSEYMAVRSSAAGDVVILRLRATEAIPTMESSIHRIRLMDKSRIREAIGKT